MSDTIAVMPLIFSGITVSVEEYVLDAPLFSDGNLYQIKDELSSTKTTYEYDLAGRIVGTSVTSLDGKTLISYTSTRYTDEKGTVESQSTTIYNEDNTVAKNVDYNYTYFGEGTGYDPSALTRFSVDGVLYEFEYDNLGRLVTRKSSVGASSSLPLAQQLLNGKSESYTYKNIAVSEKVTQTTTLVESYTDILGAEHTFEYDGNGNIKLETIVSGCATEYKSYLYDEQNRMVRYNDSELDISVVYEYDSRGNILSAVTYNYSAYTNALNTKIDEVTYSYGKSYFPDLMTSVDGSSISYDAGFNPYTWTDGRSLTWEQGRRLVNITDGTTATSYTYDENGLRVAKSGGRNTEYFIADGTYIGEKTIIDGTEYLITYLYGDSGVIGIEVNGTKYFFVKNLQGDVTAIINSAGTVVARYAYDAYGNIISATNASGIASPSASAISNLNPFRYRSYMYDQETGFYYLMSRYYDAEVGRFLNADGYVSTGTGISGYNMFSYCNNNPVNLMDGTGEFPFAIIGIAVVLIGVLFIESDVNQVPKYREAAKKKYNSNTVNVYFEGEGEADEDKVNAKLYVADETNKYVNISIDKSLDIDDKYEMEAVIDVIANSEYYSEEQFGSKKFMQAQWTAHNVSYDIAISNDLGFALMQIISGTSNPVASSSSLDIRDTDNMLKRQKIVYEIVSWCQ